MSATLYIKTKDAPTFEAFAKRVFPLLGIKKTEMRDSSNVFNGRYICGDVLGLRVQLEDADDADFLDYEFVLDIYPWGDHALEPFDPEFGVGSVHSFGPIDRDCLAGLADIVARLLAKNGMEVARPLGFMAAGQA